MLAPPPLGRPGQPEDVAAAVAFLHRTMRAGSLGKRSMWPEVPAGGKKGNSGGSWSLEHLSKPLIDCAHADDGACEGGECVMDVNPAFVADCEAAEAVQPGEAAFDNPAVASQFWLVSTPRRAMRGFMPRLMQARRHRR